MTDQHDHPFNDAAGTANYIENAVRNVPGIHDLHRMTTLLLAEGAPDAADILVVGAGGGMEIAAIGAKQSKWRFVGVDPSAAMLALAAQTTEGVADRVELVEGTVDDAPEHVFDGATCLFVLHHVEISAQLSMLRAIHRRLRPGSRFVLSEHAAIGADPEDWLTRSVLFSKAEGMDQGVAAARAAMMKQRLHLHAPAETASLLSAAGFHDPEIFYAAFSLRGWVATA